MPQIACYLGDLTQGPNLPFTNGVVLSGAPAESYFAKAVPPVGGDPVINLSFDLSRRMSLESLIGTGGAGRLPVDLPQLQAALTKLLSGLPATDPPPIGLILTTSYRPFMNAFGFMFDLDSHESAYGPRQGCALFLDKIARVTTGQGKSYQVFCDFAAYIAVHEIGHTFNLWHVPTPSFMTESPVEDFLQHCTFDKDEVTFLSHAGDPDLKSYVLPGGSNFGDRGPGAPPGSDTSYFESKSRTDQRLEISLSHRTLWHFEPMELFIRLSARAGSKKIHLPTEMDPGYARFKIWINRPDGERHRFRHSAHFCGSDAKIALAPKKPFSRDISIFRQLGGYTFDMPGKYKIQATLEFQDGRVVASNVATCRVLPAEPRSKLFRSMFDALGAPEAIELLRYKSRAPSQQTYNRLQRFITEHTDSNSAGFVHYALGKALLRSAAHESKAKRASAFRRRGVAHLERALACTTLSAYQRRVARQLRIEFQT